MNAASEQSTPHGTGPEIAPMVIADIQARVDMGKAKYGEPLRAHNGRDALLDAYQEVLDLALYLKQALVEREDVRLKPCECGGWPMALTHTKGKYFTCQYARCNRGDYTPCMDITEAVRRWNKVQEVKS